jgi:hypothetical protein
MNKITTILLGGAATAALASGSAMATGTHFSHPAVTALHEGNSVLKSRIHDPKATKLTYTYADYTYVPASDVGVNLQLLSTYWKFNSSGNICSNPKTKIKVTKKSKHGKTTTGTFTETSGTCVIVFHGDNYKLTNTSSNSDSFSSSMKSKFVFSGSKYKGTININDAVTIG